MLSTRVQALHVTMWQQTALAIALPCAIIGRRHDIGCLVARTGFEAKVQAVNASEMGRRNGGTMLSAQASERSLLMNLLARLRALDADVLVGHNIAAFDLDVLLHRLQHHKVRGLS